MMASFYYYDQNPSCFAFLCKLAPLLFKPHWDFQILNMKGKNSGSSKMTPFCKWPIKFGFVGKGPLTKFIQISRRNKRKIASPQIMAHIFKSSRKEMARTICLSDRNFQFPYLNGNALKFLKIVLLNYFCDSIIQ